MPSRPRKDPPGGRGDPTADLSGLAGGAPAAQDASPASGRAGGRRFRLHGWRHPAVVSAAGLALAAGFAQYGAIAALGDVATAFGQPADAGTIAAQAGLSGTTLGVGLAIIRLASLASLPLAGLADHHGRRRVLMACCALGLLLTFTAAFSPSYWWFVAIFAFGRPLLSATNAVAGVTAAEETHSRDRSSAIALISAGYGIGAGLTAIIRGLAGEQLGFRGLFALALVPLLAIPVLGRWLREPERFSSLRQLPASRTAAGRRPLVGPLQRWLRRRLLLLCALTFAIGFVTGPVNTMLFVYAENVLGITPATMALIVVAAAPTGLLGLLVGRHAADAFGRRVTAAAALVLVAMAGTATYSGTVAAGVGGYLLSILAASAYTPAAGALNAELFPTSVRATVAGWLTAAGVVGATSGLLAFGVLADLFDGFAPAALIVAAPVVLASALYALLPETRGLELEDSAPESVQRGGGC